MKRLMARRSSAAILGDTPVSMRLHSYVVRYDSGFAPNPFYGICTLATCKPDIRSCAEIGDWVIGTGSADKRVLRGGHLVYAMRVTESLSRDQYWSDPRFLCKRPKLRGTTKHASGDNIYRRNDCGNNWEQLDSFHSNSDGSPNADHIARDTGVDRVLISTDFVYFGGHGPAIPTALRENGKRDIVVQGRGRKVITDHDQIRQFEAWIKGLGEIGYAGPPLDWSCPR